MPKYRNKGMEDLFKFFIFTTLLSSLDGGQWPWYRRTTVSPTSTGRPTSDESQNRSALVCLDDYEVAAAKILDTNALDYYRSGADEEISLRDNKLAYKRITMRPRFLVDVSKRTISTTILGKRVSFPVGVSPTAFQKMANPEGEMANARAAEHAGTIFILSTLSTSSVEDVAAAAPHGRKWLQVYIFKNRTVTANLVRRAEAAGFEALALTVDTPLFGKRRADRRNKFRLPQNLSLANFDSDIGSTAGQTGDPSAPTGLEQINYLLDDSLTWEDFSWLKSISRLPVFVKGVLSPDDAEIAIEYGAQGVYVSNHGGRQLDTGPATIDALREIAKRVAGRCDVVVDGGIRTGTDVFKALAYGAKMVFVGRPLLWGLAVDGEEGAKNILQILKDEFNTTLALAGIQSVKQINQNYVGRSVSPQPLIN